MGVTTDGMLDMVVVVIRCEYGAVGMPVVGGRQEAGGGVAPTTCDTPRLH